MRDVVLYGAGSDLEKIIPMLVDEEYHPIAIADSNQKKKGQSICGIQIISPEDITQYDSKIIIITASFFDSIYKKIVSVLGEKKDEYEILVAPYTWLMLVNVKYNEQLLQEASEYIELNRDNILSLYDLNDVKTKNILDFILRTRTERLYKFHQYHEIGGMQYVEGYFYEGELKEIEDITFIDIGAYIGDTYEVMKAMYSNIKKYYAYEPSKDNFENLTKEINNSDDRVVFRNSALGEDNTYIEMGKSGGEFGILSEEESGFEQVQVRRLDDEDLEVYGTLVIKMDVEGAELSVLKGGINTIKKYRPIMAICVYHHYKDIYELPRFLVDNGLKYRFIIKSGIHTHLLAIPQ